MAMNSVFEFQNYVKYLIEYEKSLGGSRKGFRQKLALAAQCQPSFVSQVLKGDQNFSQEQALGISRSLSHTSTETDYFLMLIQFQRAGSIDLQKYLLEKLQNLSSQAQDLKNHIQNEGALDSERERIYYSSFLYAAIHVFCTMGPSSLQTICLGLRVSPDQVSPILSNLVEWGLIRKTVNGENLYIASDMKWHLPRNSPSLNQHHLNWRLRNIENLQFSRPENLNYTAVLSLSPVDYDLFRIKISKVLQEFAKMVSRSEPRMVCSLVIDLVSLVKKD